MPPASSHARSAPATGKENKNTKSQTTTPKGAAAGQENDDTNQVRAHATQRPVMIVKQHKPPNLHTNAACCCCKLQAAACCYSCIIDAYLEIQDNTQPLVKRRGTPHSYREHKYGSGINPRLSGINPVGQIYLGFCWCSHHRLGINLVIWCQS